MNIIKNKSERNRFMKFAVVGFIGFFIDAGVFNVCRSIFDISPEASSAISFSVAVISNFLFNRFWTYPDSRSKLNGKQLGQFFIVNVVGLAIRTGVLMLILDPIHKLILKFESQLPLNPIFLRDNLALVIVVGIVLFWNFFVNRFWTYNDVAE